MNMAQMMGEAKTTDWPMERAASLLSPARMAMYSRPQRAPKSIWPKRGRGVVLGGWRWFGVEGLVTCHGPERKNYECAVDDEYGDTADVVDPLAEFEPADGGA